MPFVLVLDKEIEAGGADPGLYDFEGELLVKTHGGQWINLQGTENMTPDVVRFVELHDDPTEEEINHSRQNPKPHLVDKAMEIVRQRLREKVVHVKVTPQEFIQAVREQYEEWKTLMEEKEGGVKTRLPDFEDAIDFVERFGIGPAK